MAEYYLMNRRNKNLQISKIFEYHKNSLKKLFVDNLYSAGIHLDIFDINNKI
jgi:hypothetical protein